MMSLNSYILGRFDELPRFIEAVENVTGLKRCSELMTTNVKRMPKGLESGAMQPDFPEVAEELRRRNAAEIAFYEAMGPIRVTVPTRSPPAHPAQEPTHRPLRAAGAAGCAGASPRPPASGPAATTPACSRRGSTKPRKPGPHTSAPCNP